MVIVELFIVMRGQSLKPLKKNKISIKGGRLRKNIGTDLGKIVSTKRAVVNRKRFLFKNMEFDVDRFEAVYKNDELTVDKLDRLIYEIPGYNRLVIKQILMRELGVRQFKDILLRRRNIGRIFTVFRKYQFYGHYHQAYIKAQRIKKLY